MRGPIRTGKLVVNLDTQTVEVNGQQIPMTAKEYKILELFSLHKGTIVTKELLAQRLYGEVDERKLKTARVVLYNLRKSLPKATDRHHYIETFGGRGYVLRELVE